MKSYYKHWYSKLKGEGMGPEVDAFFRAQIALEDNPRQALELFEASGNQGYELAYTFYAQIVFDILNDEALYPKACAYMDSVKEPNPIFNYYMAFRLANGIGCDINLRKAYDLYNSLRDYSQQYGWDINGLMNGLVKKLAESGDPEFMRQALRFHGSGEISDSQYFNYIYQLVEVCGDKSYAYSLHKAYRDGIGCKQDLSLSAYYGNLAEQWFMEQQSSMR